MIFLTLALTLGIATAQGTPAPAGEPTAEQTEKQHPLPDLDLLFRVPLVQEGRAPAYPAWAPPSWAVTSSASLALEKAGTQLLAMAEEVPLAWQPRFTPESAATAGPLLAERFLASTYAGPTLGTTTWLGFEVVESPTLGTVLRGTATVELPEALDVTGHLVLDFVPVRAGLSAVFVLGVADLETTLAALNELEGYAVHFDGPVKEADLPTGHHAERAGYSFTVPQGFRAFTERERLALNGEPVGGNSGFGGALAHQTWLDPSDPTGATSFGCVAYSGQTLEIVPPERSKRLADNFRLMSSLALRNGSYTIDGGKPIRGRSADLLSGRIIQVDPTQQGALQSLEIGDRLAYHWVTRGTQTVAGGGDRQVEVHTFYTAWSDVNLHCQAAAADAGSPLLTAFDEAMRGLRVDNGAEHPLKLSLMSEYKIWWPYSSPLLQLYWLPIPIVMFAAWLAGRGD